MKIGRYPGGHHSDCPNDGPTRDPEKYRHTRTIFLEEARHGRRLYFFLADTEAVGIVDLHGSIDAPQNISYLVISVIAYDQKPNRFGKKPKRNEEKEWENSADPKDHVPAIVLNERGPDKSSAAASNR